MAPATLAASNTIGNVPAVILVLGLLPDLPDGALAGLALLSTFAGNLLLTGSLCNIIVAERAAASGVRLSFWTSPAPASRSLSQASPSRSYGFGPSASCRRDQAGDPRTRTAPFAISAAVAA